MHTYQNREKTMKTLSHIMLLLTIFVFSVSAQNSWTRFGNTYPTAVRAYSDITNFIMLEGPGNDNPGNFRLLDQSNPALQMSLEMRNYIRRQFTYVLFDQDSYCERRSSDSAVIKQLTPLYHSEAKKLMDNSGVIVLPYFCFTLLNPAHPAYNVANIHEDWFLHSTQPPNERLQAKGSTPINTVYVMNVSDSDWQNYLVTFIRDTVNHYGYKGVFLDDMTYYPFVDSATKAKFPSGLSDEWINHLIPFVQSLKTALPTTTIICSSLGLDTTLYGPTNGLELMHYASGGALMESFGSTAWKDPLAATLSIMDFLRDNNKVMLAGAHCCPSEDATLPLQFGFPAWPTWPPYPDTSEFYRMQMSFLARYLLVTPLPNNRPFGFSFQPGEWLDSYIPYYKPWEERIGSPLGNYTYNPALKYYTREFNNCIVYVNNNDSPGSTLTITVTTGYNWYKYDYTRPGQDISATKLGVPTITLNQMEGVVLFKEIDADQKLSSGASVDSIGHWYQNRFVMHKAPTGLPLTLNTPEVVKGTQNVFSSNKYHDWNGLPDVVNYKTFQISSFSSSQLISFLNPINDATIQTTVEGALVTSQSAIQFSDPWLIDYNDPTYGNRN